MKRSFQYLSRKKLGQFTAYEAESLRQQISQDRMSQDSYTEDLIGDSTKFQTVAPVDGLDRSLPYAVRARSNPERSLQTKMKRGSELAYEVKTMSDPEWERVTLAEKQDFVSFMKDQIKQYPAEVTEQQRRRFYETTMLDPTKLEDPKSTVTDTYQRIKMGLPVQLRPQRELGVSQAMYDQGEADLFDPNDASKLEDAMTEVKQRFVDYIKKRREGLSTEADRRALANMSADLNHQTQRHLANMFKLAEQRIRDAALEERRVQMKRVHTIHAKQQQADAADVAAEGEGEGSAAAQKKPSKEDRLALRKEKRKYRQERLKAVLRDTFGLDIDTVKTLCTEMAAHERFLESCEVMTRMTLGSGFVHSQQDETLEQYTSALRSVYSLDPEKVGQLDAVRYQAALEAVPPADWATRWFQRTLLMPLQETPEFRRLQEAKAHENLTAVTQGGGGGDQFEEGGGAAPANVLTDKEKGVVSIVEKMFLSPTDTRLQGQHEKKLQYLAYVNMEAQIGRMRENAKKFDGVEHSPEAEECRLLHQAMTTAKENALAEQPEQDPFTDAVVKEKFEQIQAIVRRYLDERRVVTEAERKLKRAQRLAQKVADGGAGEVAKEIRRINAEKKREQVSRMLRLLEKDVREDILWLENVEEAERPALLPIPEPMSYVSALEVDQWRELRGEQEQEKGNPFKKKGGKAGFTASFLGQPWQIPDKPVLFWGTGVKAVEQALQHAAEDAELRRVGQALAPEHPCAANPFGWRLRKDVLDD